MSRLRSRLIALSLVGMIPALGALLYTQLAEQSAATARTLEDTLRLTRLAAKQQASLFDGAQRMLLTLAQFPAIRGGDASECDRLLANVVGDDPNVSRLMVFDPDGRRICASRPDLPRKGDTASRTWFSRAMATRKTAVSDYQISRVTGQPDIMIAHPILDSSGRIIRIAVAAMEIETLTTLLGRLEPPLGVVVTVFDRNGTILARVPDAARWQGKRVPVREIQQALNAEPRDMKDHPGVDGVSRLYVSAPVKATVDTGLYVGMGVEPFAVYGAADRMLRGNLWQLGLILLGAIVAALVGGEVFVLKPTRELIAVTRRIANGDFTGRARLTGRVRELRQLGDAFNSMTQSLQTRQIERDEAEQRLRLSEERYRMPFEHAPHPCWVYDVGTLAFMEVNRAACQHYGYTRDEFLRMRISDIRPPEDIPRMLNGVERLVGEASAKEATTWTWTHCKKDGTRITVEISSMLVTIGGRQAVIVLAHDVSAREELEHQLRQAQKMEAVGQLAGGVAHDFNNMLTAITGYSELVLEALGESHAMTPAVREIEKAGVRAAKLTRQLLAFSRKQMLTPVVLDPNVIVGEVDALLRRLIGAHIDVTIRRQPDIGAVKADPTQLEQVLLNLAVNARDAMTAGGKLTIETRTQDFSDSHARVNPGVAPGRYVVISVIDTGVGMDEATVGRIFEPFFTTKSSAEGTGLGLSVVYGIVRQSGGHVFVRSEPGKGTAFDIYLPRVEAQPSPDILPRARPKLLRGFETVLIAEDEDVVRRLLKTMLTASGYRVLEARDGVEALAVYQQHGASVDLLVTDVMMPRMNGLELAQRLSAVHPCLKVLCLSGHTGDAAASSRRDKWPFLAKPFVPAALLERVREVLDTGAPAAPAA